MKYKLILLTILLTGCTLPCIAEIDIVYPQTNMTTDVHYSTTSNHSYTSITNNTIPNDEYTHVILKNKIADNTNLIEEPEKLFDTLTGIFYLGILVFVILLFVYTIKKVLL